MKRKFLFSLVALCALCISGFANANTDVSIGVVNFANCMAESKLGKQEKTSFETLKNQMSSLIENSEKQLNEIAAKLNDSEYMDGLSPEAEDELKGKFRSLSDEMTRYQNQYYQVLNQANMKIMQNLEQVIQEAAQKVAAEKNLKMVIKDEAFFFKAPSLDVTGLVISEMNRLYDLKNPKGQVANESASPQQGAKNEAKTK